MHIRLSLVTILAIVQIDFAIVLGALPKLRLVNVVYRHGDRTPFASETFPNDPYANYSYYPVGRGQLTNKGKRRGHSLGRLLKSRYGEFLGPIYERTVLVARSTDVDRAKMSLQLVLSGLYPPAPIQQWNDELLWQPIPAIYATGDDDVLLAPDSCSQYVTEYDRVKKTVEVKKKIAAFSDLMKSLEKHTGKKFHDTSDMYVLYHTFDAQSSANLTLPKWAHEVYPDGELLQAVSLDYQISSYNDYMKRINGGTILRKIYDDVVSYAKGSLEKGRKLFLYSGHESNIASLLLTLGVYKPHVPSYSSAVILELWQVEVEYYIKVLYRIGIPSKVITLQIPGCSELCPIDKFQKLLGPVMATDKDLLCP